MMNKYPAGQTPPSAAADEKPQEKPSTATFDELYTLYAQDVLRMSYFYLGDRQKAEDVCQDVFVKLFTTQPALLEGHEKSWLLKVAVNRCRDHWRSSWLKRVVLGSPVFELIPGPDEIAELSEKQAMMTAVNQLPVDFREVVLLFYYQNLQINEIAAMLDVAEGTVSSRLSRARKRLESILKGDDPQ